eukprot:12938722-Prorocentrum_lima.AAC.1
MMRYGKAVGGDLPEETLGQLLLKHARLNGEQTQKVSTWLGGRRSGTENTCSVEARRRSRWHSSV